MTLEEAILHAEEVADEKKEEACNLYDDKNYEESRECIWCAEEHRQLAEWLKDYKRLLEQELCDDAISRDAVEEIINDIRDCISVEGYWAILERMKKLSSVKPQESKWIPVSERLPEIHNYMQEYIVTIKGNFIRIAFFTETNGKSWWSIDNVKAWMLLPEPYKAESEVTK